MIVSTPCAPPSLLAAPSPGFRCDILQNVELVHQADKDKNGEGVHKEDDGKSDGGVQAESAAPRAPSQSPGCRARPKFPGSQSCSDSSATNVGVAGENTRLNHRSKCDQLLVKAQRPFVTRGRHHVVKWLMSPGRPSSLMNVWSPYWRYMPYRKVKPHVVSYATNSGVITHLLSGMILQVPP